MMLRYENLGKIFLKGVYCFKHILYICLRITWTKCFSFYSIKLYPYKVWGDIRWKQILTDYPDGFTHLFLYCACFNLIKTYPDYRKSPIQDVLNYGLQKTKSVPNKRLKTLKLNEKQELEIVKYDNKLFK